MALRWYSPESPAPLADADRCRDELGRIRVPVDHHAEAMAAVTSDHHGQALTGTWSVVGGQVEYSGRLYQAHGLIVEHRVLFALEFAQVVAIEHENTVDPAQRECIRLAGDLDEQGADDRDRNWQLEHEPCSLAWAAGNTD